MMEYQAGFRPHPPTHEIPKTIVHAGAMSFHNIRVDRSTIGAINTGQVQVLDAAVTVYRDMGNTQLADALKELTEAVVSAGDIEAETRAETVELLSHLMKEAGKPSEHRSRPVARSIMSSLDKALSAIERLSSLWAKLQPLLGPLFA